MKAGVLPIWLGLLLMLMGLLLLSVASLLNLGVRIADMEFKAGFSLFLIGIVAAALST